jgi:acetyltransferase-like isoleucine patch superfamily enzyme
VDLRRRFLQLPLSAGDFVVGHAPGPVGHRLRHAYWKRRLAHLGDDVVIDVGVYFQSPEHISIEDGAWIDRGVIILAGAPGGDRLTFEQANPDYVHAVGEVHIGRRTHVAPYCVLSGIGGISIGANCGIASHSAIYSYSHHYRNLGDRTDDTQYSFTPRARPDQQSMILRPVAIADYCAVGLHCVVLPGTSLRRGTWVASGSTVSGAFPAQSVVSAGTATSTKSIANLRIKE